MQKFRGAPFSPLIQIKELRSGVKDGKPGVLQSMGVTKSQTQLSN